MNNLLDSLKTSSQKTGSGKQSYSLNEILFIMSLFAEGNTLDQVSEISGRSKHTLRYKFLEGEVVLNGKAVVRSVKKYKDMQELFADHKAEWIGDQDIKDRIEEYKQSISGKIAQAI